MRSRVRRSRLALTLVFLAGAAWPAGAGDVLIMPFSCEIVAGKPELVPSDDRAHRIFGTREQRKIQTCSTVDAKRCRQWTAFKFDMDCGGERVAWMDVFANASAHTRRRVSERNGRLRVADTPLRSKRVDEMCARRMGPGMEWWSVDRLCEEASPLNSPTSTDMPAGFAPMVGLDASILPEEALRSRRHKLALAKADDEAGAPTKKSSEVESEPAHTAPAPDEIAEPEAEEAAAAQAQVAPGEASRDALQSAPPADRDSPAASPTSVERKSAPPAPAPPAEAAPVSVLNAAEAPPPPLPTTQAAGEAAAMKTDRLATTNVQPPQPVEHGPELQSETGGAETVVAKTRESAPVAVAAAASTKSIPETTGSIADERNSAPRLDTGSVALPADAGLTLSMAIGAFAVAAVVMIALVLNWLFRSSSGGIAAASPRAERKPSAPHAPGGALVPVAARSNQIAVTRRDLAPSAAAPQSIGDRIPVSRPEALAVLGMGVASEGNVASLKKIIDGLRMNWHPDLAGDDADRRTRELRLKQINAAWEILAEKRVGA